MCGDRRAKVNARHENAYQRRRPAGAAAGGGTFVLDTPTDTDYALPTNLVKTPDSCNNFCLFSRFHSNPSNKQSGVISTFCS